MTNTYTVDGATVHVHVPTSDGTMLIALIDLEDLPSASMLPGTWAAVWQKTARTYYVRATWTGDFPGRRRSNAASLHRVVTRAPLDRDVDHLNHNGLDNRKTNLVFKTRSQNLLNRKGAQSNSGTGILGVQHVTVNKGAGRTRTGYIAQLRVNGTKYRSAVKDTADEAAAWYWTKRKELGVPDPESRVA